MNADIKYKVVDVNLENGKDIFCFSSEVLNDFIKFVSPLGGSLRSGIHAVIVAEIEGHSEAVAYLLCEFDSRSTKADLLKLYVDSGFRKRGIGLACLEKAVEYVSSREVCRIFVGFIDKNAKDGKLYQRFVQEVIPQFQPRIRFCIVAPNVSESERIREWIPNPFM